MLTEPCGMLANGIANDDVAGVEIMCSSGVRNYPMCDRCYITRSQDVLLLFI